MCGIAGIGYEGKQPDWIRESIQSMVQIQQHRGPDGTGYFYDDGIAFGHSRLAIIDISDSGSQPMTDSDGILTIVFNGEIYNHVELRSQLHELGHVFCGTSDTEVLLLAYKQWGKSCLDRLRGMFAFGIWNSNEKILFAARDRLGIKPFHYCTPEDSMFVFSSELKALVPMLKRVEFDPKLAEQYLAWNLLDHDENKTMIQDVYKLPPGHMLIWNQRDGIKIQRYWTLEMNGSLISSALEKKTWIREFRDEIEESVKYHLRSDVPVGTSLSGGLDSSALMCMASEKMKQSGDWHEGWHHAFSACFRDRSIDERPYIREVINQTGCRSHAVFPTGDMLSKDIEKWIWHQEEPTGGTGAYAHFCVARLAKEAGVKVLLDGQGGDELFAGYRKFILTYWRELIRNRHYFDAVLEFLAFFTSPSVLKTSRLAEGKRYLFHSDVGIDILWSGVEKPSKPEFLQIGNTLANKLFEDITIRSLPVLLRYDDRNTMAFGVESRVPFLDHKFVEWQSKLSADVRLRRGWSKWILREALCDILPRKIYRRKTKLGFSTPFYQWMTQDLSAWLQDSLSNAKFLSGIVQKTSLERLVQYHQKHKKNKTIINLLFRLAMFENWCDIALKRKFIA